MTNSQKERLEEELNFLKESFEAEVITKEEFENGKERIENQLKELDSESKPAEEDITIKEVKEGAALDAEKQDSIKEETVIVQEDNSQEEQEIEKDEEAPEEEQKEIQEDSAKSETSQEEVDGASKTDIGEEHEDLLTKEEPEHLNSINEEERFINKKFIFTVFIVIVVLIGLSFNFCSKDTEDTQPLTEEEAETSSVVELEEEKEPLCSSDNDCKKEGTIGLCNNPRTEEAKCEFKEPIEFTINVVNDMGCEECDTKRIIQTTKQLFPGVKIELIDKNSDKGETLVSDYDLDVLPSYIFNPEVEKTHNFNEFKSALEKKDTAYLLKDTASGANYFFNRALIRNKLDLFIESESPSTTKIKENIGELLELFGTDIVYNEHIISEKEKESLKGELAITSYPTLLFNNQLKIGGVQSSEAMRDIICRSNDLDKCDKSTSTI